MHPLHDYISAKVADLLKKRRVVVWYDPRGEFRPFIVELGGSGQSNGAIPEVETVPILGAPVRLVQYDGSFLGVRVAVEPLVEIDQPEALVIYVSGVERDRKGSILMELEMAGECYEPQLKRLARHVLRKMYSDGQIDAMLAPEKLTWQDMVQLVSGSSSEPPSVLNAIFPGVSGNEAILSAWLASDARDEIVEEKQAGHELLKLVRSRMGLEAPDDVPLGRLKARAVRFVLIGEFRDDLRCDPPAALDAAPKPPTKDHLQFVREVARRLRRDHGEAYCELADRVQEELKLPGLGIPPESLGSIDTFRFEERALLRCCDLLVADGRYDEALQIVDERSESFWLQRDVARKAQWEACRRTAVVGKRSVEVRAAVDKMGTNGSAWIQAYTADDGWFRLDQAYRRLEAWVAGDIDQEPEGERSLQRVRRAYEDTCTRMAEKFSRVLEQGQWSVPGVLTQSRVYSDVVEDRPRPTAYFLVDAMRYEMGVELGERLPQALELSVRPAVAVIPTITPMGMAALLPGAAASYNVVAQNGRLGVRIDGTFLPDLAARRKFFAARAPGLVDITLDELLSLSSTKLKKKLDGAKLVVVRSQEIDKAGEDGFSFQARQIMDLVIDNVARAIRKLAAVGICHTVVSADHGHLFSLEKDESMRVEAPGGEQVELHRRCWIGRGGATPGGCVRIGGAALGYDTDLDFVFPPGVAVFKAGGDLVFHHGGLSLQELLVPVLTLRMKAPPGGKQPETRDSFTVTGLRSAVTNRIIQVEITNQELLELKVRPVLMAGSQEVGDVGMVVGADKEGPSVKLPPGGKATLALKLASDACESVRFVVHDPETDAVLWQSDEMLVKLM